MKVESVSEYSCTGYRLPVPVPVRPVPVSALAYGRYSCTSLDTVYVALGCTIVTCTRSTISAREDSTDDSRYAH